MSVYITPSNAFLVPADTNHIYKPKIINDIKTTLENPQKHRIPPPLSCQKLTYHTPVPFVSLGIGLICDHQNKAPTPINGDINEIINNYCKLIYLLLLEMIIEMEI